MLYKFKKIALLFIAATGLLYLSGCVDEPYIEPVTDPYSAIKFGNYVSNAEAIRVAIDVTNDGTKNPVAISLFESVAGLPIANDLGQVVVSEYFDVTAGNRGFYITNPLNGDVLFDENIDVPGYEENFYLVYGTFDPDPDQNRLAIATIFNGVTYLDDFHQPADKPEDEDEHVNLAADEFNLKVVNASGSDAADSVAMVIVYQTVNDTSIADTLFNREALPTPAFLEKGKYAGANLKAGSYTAEFYRLEGDESVSLMASSESTNFEGSTISYFILWDSPQGLDVANHSEVMMPARPKVKD